MSKSMKIALKNDRVERVERAMINLEMAINGRLGDIAEAIKTVHAAQALFYEELMARTLTARWKRLVAWLGRK